MSEVAFDAARHAYWAPAARRYLRSVTGVLRAAGRLADVEWFGTAESRRRGRAVHDLTVATEAAGRWDGPGRPLPWPATFPLPAPEILVPGGGQAALVACPEDLAPYLDAFWRWRALFAPVWIHVEATLARIDLDLAGRPDRIGALLGAAAVLEIKTGMPADWHRLQTSGYDLLAPLPFPRRRHGLYLRPDGKFRFVDYDGAGDAAEFLRLCAGRGGA